MPTVHPLKSVRVSWLLHYKHYVYMTTMGEGQVGRPANHRYKDWKEYILSEKVHLNDKKRVSMAKAVVSY